MFWIPVGIIGGLVLLSLSGSGNSSGGGSSSSGDSGREERERARLRARHQERDEALRSFRRNRDRAVRGFISDLNVPVDPDAVLDGDPTLNDIETGLLATITLELDDARLRESQERLTQLRLWKMGIQQARLDLMLPGKERRTR